MEKYTCQPQTREELQNIIIERIKYHGLACDLNDIDVSMITDMGGLFKTDESEYGHMIFKDFNGDVSQWNVKNVKHMGKMFAGCEKFNGDLSGWDVRNTYTMYKMFSGCKSFNGDLSKWNVKRCAHFEGMFEDCEKFNGDLSKWRFDNAHEITKMFYGCHEFKQDLDGWKIKKYTDKRSAFKDCPTKPKWYDWRKYQMFPDDYDLGYKGASDEYMNRLFGSLTVNDLKGVI